MTGARAMRLPISATPPPAGSVSPATPSPGKAPRGKNRSRHGKKKQQKPEQSSYRQLRYAALNATAGEADASMPLPTAVLAQGAIPAATAINGDRPDARANGYSTYRRGSGAGYRNNFHSDQGAQIRMTSVPWPGAIAGCGWRNMMCMLAASVIDTSAQGSRETRVFSAATPYWPQPTAADVTPANEALSGYGNLVGGLWTGTANRGDALLAIGTAFAGAMARAISAAPGGVEKRTAALGTSTENGVSGLSDAQDVRAPATTASAAMVKREPVGTPPHAQKGTASVNVKGAPVHAASPAVDRSAAAIVTGAPINVAPLVVDTSDAAIVRGGPINAAPPAAGPFATVSPFAVAVSLCVTGAINASVGERFSDLNTRNIEWDAILTCLAEVIEGTKDAAQSSAPDRRAADAAMPSGSAASLLQDAYRPTYDLMPSQQAQSVSLFPLASDSPSPFLCRDWPDSFIPWGTLNSCSSVSRT